jgi:hypothetical protein
VLFLIERIEVSEMRERRLRPVLNGDRGRGDDGGSTKVVESKDMGIVGKVVVVLFWGVEKVN